MVIQQVPESLRKKVYTQMLHQIETCDYKYVGFCTFAGIILNKINPYYCSRFSEHGLKILPELWAYKPKKNYRWKTGETSGWWWSPYKRAKRVKVLKEIIASMK